MRIFLVLSCSGLLIVAILERLLPRLCQNTVTGDPNDTVFGSVVWDEFKKWGQEENSGTKWGRNSFYVELSATPGVTKGVSHDEMVVFRGMRMKEPPDPMEDELI